MEISEEPEVVVFHNRRPRKNGSTSRSTYEKSQETKKNDDKTEKNEMTLKEARFDVFKFGIKGLNKAEQENAKVQLAIKLGAKPLKNKCENYKEILKRKKDEKEQQAELLKENSKFNAKIAKPSMTMNKNHQKANVNNRRSKINKGNVGKINGHIGTFSDGVLKLKKSDLKKLNINKKK